VLVNGWFPSTFRAEKALTAGIAKTWNLRKRWLRVA